MAVKNILVHSCRVVPDGLPRDLLVPGERYIGELGVGLNDQSWYFRIGRCRCKRLVSVADATEFVKSGWAVWVLKSLKRGIVVDEHKIWMPIVRSKVPRVDLISRADVERAFIGSDHQSKHYVYNRLTKRYVVIQAIPEGMTKKQWQADAEKEIKFERRIRKQFSQYINDCHSVTMDSRAELMAPFKEDPFAGRVLFPFSKDQRTVGGCGV
jgi:hypothetical protein